MSETTLPVELLEAQRRIRAKQVPAIVEMVANAKPQADSVDSALDSLRHTLATAKVLPDINADAEARAVTIRTLRSTWNAPERHVSRKSFSETATQWIEQRVKLTALIGSGFTAALVGRRGPGKTQLGVCLMQAATERLRSAYYCTAMDYFMRIKDSFDRGSGENQSTAQRFFIKPKLLVIDEVNVRSESTWEDNMLTDLIGKRYNALLDTLLIGNENAVEFEASVGPSIIDRLNETGGIIECNWPSFRTT